jgi:1-acyl-sn-glycerol-3-phosphate acyltransferase
MKSKRRHPFRVSARLIWFGFEVMLAILLYCVTAACAPRKTRRAARALWLQRASRRHLKIFGYTATVAGPVPRRGLLVTNHLSYLDILAIAAVTPAVFVSKADVRGWPVFGWLASLAGTVFVERDRRTHVGDVNDEIQKVLDDGALVVVFPEGTSSNGTTVLPFRTSLLEPAARSNHPVTTGWLHYELTDGDAREEVCYWGDHTFFPHLVNLTGKQSVHATIRFGNFQKQTGDRKELARQLHVEVTKLKNSHE